MKKYAYLLVIIGAGMWGTMGLFVRNLNKYGLMSMEIVEVRSIVACLLLFLFLGLLKRDILRVHIKDLWCFLGTGVLSMVFFNYCYFRTISLTSLSTAAILLYTAPIFVMLLSYPLFREKITLHKIICLVGVFVGCAMVSGMFTGDGSLSAYGVLVGLGSGIGYALYSIFSRYALNRGYGSLTITAYTFLFAAIGGIAFTDIGKLGYKIQEGGVSLAGLVILYVLVTTIAPYILYTTGLKYVENGKASVMATIEPVVATLIGVFVFNEKLTLTMVAGIVFVIVALGLLNSKRFEQKVAE